MARSLVLLLLSSVSILYVNGHASGVDKIHQINVRPIAENGLRRQNEILWMDQLAPISLQVKNEAPIQRGKTDKLYRKVRAPSKMMDRQLMKKSGVLHKSFKRGLSRADKQVRRGLLVSHDLVKQGVITLDKQVSRGSKRVHDSLRRSSNWLDNKFVAGSRTAHRSVKRGLKPVDKGLAVSSVIAYSKVKKGVTTVDRGLKNSARAIDKQLASGKIMKVPAVNLFLNKFVGKKGKKSKHVAVLPPPSESELKESEVPDDFKDGHFAPFEIEEETTPPSTPKSSMEVNKHSEELVNFEGAQIDGNEEGKAKHEEKEGHTEEGHKEEGKEHVAEINNEEPTVFDMADYDDFDDAKHEGHDHGQNDHDHGQKDHDHLEHEELEFDKFDHDDHPTAGNDNHNAASDHGVRSVQKSGKKRYFNVGKLKQFAPRSAPKSLRRSFAKVSKPLSLSSKYNLRSLPKYNLRSLPKKGKSLWARSNKQKSGDSETIKRQ